MVTRLRAQNAQDLIKTYRQGSFMECIRCNFKTSRMYDWRRHIRTQAHLLTAEYVCVCDNAYSTKANLKRHERTCSTRLLDVLTKQQEENRRQLTDELHERDVEQADRIRHRDAKMARDQAQRDAERDAKQAERDAKIAEEQAKHQAEIAELRAELASKTMNTTNNNVFNMNFFLTETCKHAKTLDQFVNALPCDLTMGLAIDDFFVQSLARAPIEDRPIHCVDEKRGRLILKQDDKWERDQSKVDPLIMHTLNLLRVRFSRELDAWALSHPNHLSDDKLQDEWLQMMTFICADAHSKFLRRVAKATTIPKHSSLKISA